MPQGMSYWQLSRCEGEFILIMSYWERDRQVSLAAEPATPCCRARACAPSCVCWSALSEGLRAQPPC